MTEKTSFYASLHVQTCGIQTVLIPESDFSSHVIFAVS